MREIRIPLCGMVQLSELEWDVINSRPFQRLRRIKQLAFSDYVYPGAVHTRFEHSIGVMYLATQAFDHITCKENIKSILQESLGYDDARLSRARRMLRLAALTHDLGHLPFSHAAEGALPIQEDGKPYKHEHYSSAIIRFLLHDILENHEENQDFLITSREVADFLEGRINKRLAALAPWRDLITGELDCDRMDYLRRDSYHTGVQYGSFDVDRVLSTLTLIEDPETNEPRVGVEEGGLLAVESLILARYYMYQQVYFHKVRRFLDLQYVSAVNEVVKHSPIKPPTSKEAIEQYLDLDDWTMHGRILLLAENGFRPAHRILTRDCMKVIYETLLVSDEGILDTAESRLKDAGIEYVCDRGARGVTRKFGVRTNEQRFENANIYVLGKAGFRGVRSITACSRVAVEIPDTMFIGRIYVSDLDRERVLDGDMLGDLGSTTEGGE